MKSESMKSSEKVTPRKGCKDIWNAFMAKDAIFGKYDIPLCPTTAIELPKELVTWEEAKKIHKDHIDHRDKVYFVPAYINWYIDDYKFDGPGGIWHDWRSAMKIIKHFAGVITPDFSTYQDFPEATKIYATYRMRLYGYWLGKRGCAVINNVRWGTEESYSYCFEGIPQRSVVAIGTVGGGRKKLRDRERFENGFFKMLEILEPHTILVCGSAKGTCFDVARKKGINIVSYPSRKAKSFWRGDTI